MKSKGMKIQCRLYNFPKYEQKFWNQMYLFDKELLHDILSHIFPVGLTSTSRLRHTLYYRNTIDLITNLLLMHHRKQCQTPQHTWNFIISVAIYRKLRSVDLNTCGYSMDTSNLPKRTISERNSQL